MTAVLPEVSTTGVVGAGIDRVDGPKKVTGSAPYPTDVSMPNLVHAVLVRSTIAAGRIRSIDSTAALAAEGVLAVISHENAPKLKRGPRTLVGPAPPPPFQHDRILHYGQYVAVVVAETAEQATHAAGLVRVDYEPTEPLLDFDDPRAKVRKNPTFFNLKRGDVEAGLAAADVVVDNSFTTPEQTHNPLGLFATVAYWEGDRLTVHDATQHTYNERNCLARTFGIPRDSVRVLAPFVGGAFGAGLRTWPHVVLAALAARTVERPVKLVLTRPQMFTGIGHRPNTVQRIRVGATRDGRLVAIDHEGTASVAMEDDNIELIAMGSAAGYACPNVATRDRDVRLNVPCPGFMRAPGEAEGNFALESTLDEVAGKLGIDPVELRLRNYAEVHPQTGLPWSSKALRECYEVGAERFGWWDRNPEPGSMRDGNWLVGYGMAGVTFTHFQGKCRSRATLYCDGTAYVRSAATDIGTGTYTVMTQVAADALGLGVDDVRFDLGDTAMPMSPQAGGSGLTAALSTAVADACAQLVKSFLDLVKRDEQSPLRGCSLADVEVAGGRIHRVGDPARGERYTDILERHGLNELTADGGASAPGADMVQLFGAVLANHTGRAGRAALRATRMAAPAGAFGAKFVEVRVDRDLGIVRVARLLSVIDGGRILNEKTARSQIIGGAVGGIGQALLEETVTDPGTGRVANANLADYLVPVHADVPDLDVVFVGGPDPVTPIGAKGIGEVGLVGVAAAIANAVHHATGKRVRSLPITVEKLL